MSYLPAIFDDPLFGDEPGTSSRPGRAGGRDRSVSPDLLAGLNEAQAEAVVARDAALLIVAGAGSGKTTVLTRRIAGLLETGEAWPSQVLAITFTNKAAAEMRERIGALVGDAASGMWISTFHSACVRILRRQAEAMGMRQSFTIYDAADSRALVKRILKELSAEALGLTPGGALSRISRLKNELTDIDAFARDVDTSDPQEVAFTEVFRRYTQALRRANALDFDDIIAETVYLFRAFPEVAALYQRRFRHVLVDEYQDTNHAQYALIRELVRPVEAAVATELAARHGYSTAVHAADGSIPPANLTVVGDSDQSIYAFRGADIRNIIEFERDFPGARVVLLEQNYRSTQNILDAANAVIDNNVDRPVKRLFSVAGAGDPIIAYTGYSGHDEAQFVADEIEQLQRAGTSNTQIAVFVRTNAQTRPLEEIFIRLGIPYRIPGGTKFYERAEVKDAFGYLTQAANPDDDMALRRILNVPKRGIGPVTEATLQAEADRLGVPLRDVLDEAGSLGLGPKVAHSIAELSTLLRTGSQMAVDRPAHEVATFLLTRSGIVDALRATGDAQDEARAENLEELVAQAKEFQIENPEATLVDFLTSVALFAAADELDDGTGSVSIMTLHTAKGLEFDAVFLTGVEEDLLPHRMSINEPGGIAEERRLFYVGITRAKKRLFLSLATSRASFGDVQATTPSRFLEEVPTALLTWRDSGASAALTTRSAGGFGERGGYGGRSSGGFRSGGQGRAGFGARESAVPRPKTQWRTPVSGTVRDNGDLALAVGDKIRHTDFGDGVVTNVVPNGPRTIAEVKFDGGTRRLLVKVAPIEKL